MQEIDSVFGFETDTVWGIGCSIESEAAVNKIYEIKGRDRTKPLILMSNNITSLLRYVEEPCELAFDTMVKYFPGKLTVILKKSKHCPDYICEGYDTVGIRVPNNRNFWLLCAQIEGSVLATTSLNFSGEPPCLNYEEACEKFGNICKIMHPQKPALLTNEPSTIVDFTGIEPKILRQGEVVLDFTK